MTPKDCLYTFTMDPFPGGGRFEHHFDATTAAKYLDARTAAVLALGEKYLDHVKSADVVPSPFHPMRKELSAALAAAAVTLW